MSRLTSIFTMGASGAGGAFLYNHSDMLDFMVRDGSRGLAQGFTASGSSDVTQLTKLVSNLSSQVDMMAAHQRQSRDIIVSTSQPSSVLGVPLWKIVGLVGTAGTIYMKMSGYEMRDVVYVSKKHFDSATAALKDQYDQLELVMAHLKGDLMARVGLVDQKLDETRESISLQLQSEVGKVDERVTSLANGVSKVDARLAKTGVQVDYMMQEMILVKQGLQNIAMELDSRLLPMHQNIEEFQEQSSRAQAALCQEMGTMQGKMDEISRSTASLHAGLNHQSKGIGLLVEFASRSEASSSSSPSLVDALQLYSKEDEEVNAKPVVRTKSASRLVRKSMEGLAGVKLSA
jgi:hypothetical protein